MKLARFGGEGALRNEAGLSSRSPSDGLVRHDCFFCYMFVALFAPWLAPFGEAEIFPVPFAPWDETHVFGTDQIGRDILSRLIYGARNTMGIALLTTLLSFLIGGALGLIAAIDRGLVDQVLGRAMDVLMAIPSLIFALMLLSIFGSR